MKVTDLTLTLFKWRSDPWNTGNMSFGGDIPLGVVTIQSDEGIQGHSFLGSSFQGADTFVKPLMNLLKPLVLGRDPLQTGSIWRDMYGRKRSVHLRVIGAVDVALWDLAGKVANLPIHRMLGSCRNTIPAYASAAWFATPQAVLETSWCPRASTAVTSTRWPRARSSTSSS